MRYVTDSSIMVNGQIGNFHGEQTNTTENITFSRTTYVDSNKIVKRNQVAIDNFKKKILQMKKTRPVPVHKVQPRFPWKIKHAYWYRRWH